MAVIRQLHNGPEIIARFPMRIIPKLPTLLSVPSSDDVERQYRKAPLQTGSSMTVARRAPLTRSEMMARVRAKDTAPEIAVRRALWAAGLRYRLHDKRLPGRPDIVFPSRSLVVFVHGCFWHAHDGCPRHTIPKSRQNWWRAKITRDKERDAEVLAALEALGWTALVVWECEVKELRKLDELACMIKAAPNRQGQARLRPPALVATDSHGKGGNAPSWSPAHSMGKGAKEPANHPLGKTHRS